MLISITYLSTATVPFSATDLAGLLASTREKNHEAGLTGVLLYAGGHFIQALEGPEEAVDATFARISRDPRHRNVYVALREPIKTRIFPDWSMGFESLTIDEAAPLPGFNDHLHDKPLTDDDRTKLGRPGVFLRAFRDNMR